MKTNIHFPELEDSLQAQLDGLAQKVRMDAVADGKQNLPGQEDDLESFFESHHHGYNKLIALIYSTLQMGSKCIAVIESQQLYMDVRNSLNTRKRLGQERLIDVNQYLKGTQKTFSIKWIFLAASLLLGVLDGLWNQSFFEYKGASYWFSFCMSVLFGCMLFIIAHWLIPYIHSLKSKYDRVILMVCLGITLFVLLGEMALGRARLLGNQDTGIYLILSLGMFLLSCFLSYKYHEAAQTNLNNKDMRNEDLAKEKSALGKELKQISNDIRKLDEKEMEEREYARALFEYATGLRQKIVDEAHQSFFIYKKMNRLNRTSVVPPCMQYGEYPFTFTAYSDLSKDNPPYQRYGFVASIVAFIILGLSSCLHSGSSSKVDEAHSIVIDLTDPLPVYPDSNQIKNLLQLDENLWKGVEVSVGTITDTDINPVQTFVLPKENRLTGSFYKRQQQVAVFFGSPLNYIATCGPNGEATLGHSIVYRTLAQHLAVLGRSTAKIKTLVVYSNLYENSDLANFYDPKVLKQLKELPEGIQQRFEEAVALGDLSTIIIYLVYRPIDYQDNLHYVTVSGFFKKMFESHGATVQVVASL